VDVELRAGEGGRGTLWRRWRREEHPSPLAGGIVPRETTDFGGPT
jgi:hypothetical protein